MPQSYSLARVKMFLRRIKEEQERAEVFLAKVRANPEDYDSGTLRVCCVEIDLCEDLLRIAELHFGDDVKEE